MPHRPIAPVVALIVVSVGSGHAAWAAKKPSTTTTTLSARETRGRELRALVGEASAQEAVLLSEIADIEARLDDLDEAGWGPTQSYHTAPPPAHEPDGGGDVPARHVRGAGPVRRAGAGGGQRQRPVLRPALRGRVD